MNVDFYRNYVKIVECGTLSAASRELLIAQPALTNQIKQFEHLYGTKLFIRNARKMEPTDAGRILYEKAKGIVMLEDAAHKEIEACVNGSLGTVRIGMTQAHPDTGINRLLQRFHMENPGIRFEFYETTSGDVLEMLKSHLLEIGIVRTSGLLPPDFTERICMKQTLCAYFRKDNPWLLTNAPAISIRSLTNVPLAISRGFESILRDIFLREDVQPTFLSISTSRMIPCMWAENRMAVAILCTGETEKPIQPGMLCRPLISDHAEIRQELKATRSFITSADQKISAAAECFLKFCCSALDNN